MEVEIDIEKLRSDLMDYFGTAMGFFPVATMDLIKVQNASDEELINIALKNNFDVYGGCYLDENQELVVLLTEDTPENREKVCADMNVNMGSAKFKEVKYSKAYLDAIHEKITAVMMNREFETIVTSGVMEMDNFVEVTLTEKDDKAIEFLNRLDNTGAINIVYGMVSTTAELITTK